MFILAAKGLACVHSAVDPPKMADSAFRSAFPPKRNSPQLTPSRTPSARHAEP
jgi:hypothetical protein